LGAEQLDELEFITSSSPSEQRKCAQNERRTRSSRTWLRSTTARGACSATQGSTGVSAGSLTSSHSLPPPVHQNNEERKCAQNVRRTRSSRTWLRSTMARGACSATQGSTGVPSSLRRVRIHYLLQSIRTTKKENVLRMRGEREAAGHGCEAQRPAALALLLPKVLPAGCQAA
jgi:hypothetical protein